MMRMSMMETAAARDRQWPTDTRTVADRAADAIDRAVAPWNAFGDMFGGPVLESPPTPEPFTPRKS